MRTIKQLFPIIFLLLLTFAFASPATAAEIPATSTDELQQLGAGNYDPSDIAAVVAIIENNGLTGYDKNDPLTWDFVKWEDRNGTDRIVGIELPKKQLTGTLEVGALTELVSLICDKNQLIGINGLSGLSQLKTFVCSNNQISDLGVLPQGLTVFVCAQNSITGTLDLSGLTNLDTFHCQANQITELKNLPTSLSEFLCSDNRLTGAVDFSHLINLELLYCEENQLTDLGVLPGSLTEIRCGNNQLTDLGPLPKYLEELACFRNNLSGTFDISGLSYLAGLYCSENQITSLGALPDSLTDLSCDNNAITTLGKLPSAMTYLSCEGNNINDLGELPTGLQSLWCSRNPLTNLDSLPITLEYLFCHHTQLSSLVLPANLKEIYCSDTPLREIVTREGNRLTISATANVVMGIAGDNDPVNNNNKGFDLANNVITLSALPGKGRVFEQWHFNPTTPLITGDDTSEQISFLLDQDLKVTPWFQYSILSAPPTYTADTKSCTFSVDADPAYYVKTTIDEKDVSTHYTAGSTVIDIDTDYLKTLPNGVHGVRALFTDGYADTQVVVELPPAPKPQPDNLAKTTDDTPLLPLLATSAFCLACSTVALAQRRFGKQD